MAQLSSRLASLFARTDVRLGGFGLAGVVAIYIGFIAVPVRAADLLVRRGGYYLMALTVALFVHALWRRWRTARRTTEPLTRGQWLAAAGVIAGLSSIAITSEPYRSKILNDEFVLQSAAFNMHYFRDVAVMMRGYEIQGVFLSTDNYLDKRPYLYPFAVCLLHDLTGYRVANAYLVNSLLMPSALLLAFALGRRMAGWRGGMLAALLLGSLPLLGQNATGSGMELLNIVMLLATMLLGATYLREPDESTVAPFVLCTILLAQARYESALYAAPAALVVVLGWIRLQRVCLPWQAIIAPFLLLPIALQNKVVANTPLLWELHSDKTARFDIAYFSDSLKGAIEFLFNRSPERANSLFLSVLGLLALGWCGWRLLRRWPSPRHSDPARLAFFCFSLAIVANTLLVFCYYWSSFNDPMASRFSLPLHLLLAFAVVMMAASLDRWLPALRALLVAAGLFAVASGTAKFAYHYYSHLGVEEIDWPQRYVDALPPANRLILTNRTTLPWLLEKHAAILLDRARIVADRLHYQLQQPTFQEILVLQTLRPTTADGDHQLDPDDELPEFFKLAPLAEKRFGTRRVRISRLVAVDLPAGWDAREPDPSRLRKLPVEPNAE